MSKLREVWQREINGMARRHIRRMDVHGMGQEAALETITRGADLETVAEALGWKNGEPPEGLVKLATEDDLAAMLRHGLGEDK